jgi:hypothetical protein
MKKIVIAITAALTISLGAMAQEGQPEGNRGRGRMNQTEMIQRRTDAMTQRLGLNETQAKKLLELNTKYAGKMGPRGGMQRPPRQAAPIDTAQRPRPEMRGRGQMPEEMRKNMEAYDTELKAILTEEQYEAYKKDLQNRPQRGGEGRRGPRRN